MTDLYAYSETETGGVSTVDILSTRYTDLVELEYPKGFAWNWIEGSLIKNWVRGVGRVIGRFKWRVFETFGHEMRPSTARETLLDWENDYGLPGLNPSPPTTLAGRQQAVHAKATQKASDSEPLFLAIAASMGYPDAVIEPMFDPFLATSECTNALYGDEGGWTWSWTLHANATTENDDALVFLVNEHKLAHTHVIFNFEIEPEDPLEQYSTSFVGESADVTDYGFTWYGDETVATQTVADGELHLESTSGGANEAWWYTSTGFGINETGGLAYVLIEGNFDFRARVRVRNAAGNAPPPGGVGQWRFAGIAAHDIAALLDDDTASGIHLALGGSPNGINRLEWKIMDYDGVTADSTFDDEFVPGTLDYDLRIVRVGQIFYLLYRATVVGVDLRDNTGWTQIGIGDIVKDENTPPRDGPTGPVAAPDTMAVGIMPPYAGPTTTLDCQMWVEEVAYLSAA